MRHYTTNENHGEDILKAIAKIEALENNFKYSQKEAEEFAIKFAEWCDDEGYTQVNNLSLWKSLDDEEGKYSKQLLEIFKKENGL